MTIFYFRPSFFYFIFKFLKENNIFGKPKAYSIMKVESWTFYCYIIQNLIGHRQILEFGFLHLFSIFFFINRKFSKMAKKIN